MKSATADAGTAHKSEDWFAGKVGLNEPRQRDHHPRGPLRKGPLYPRGHHRKGGVLHAANRPWLRLACGAETVADG